VRGSNASLIDLAAEVGPWPSITTSKLLRYLSFQLSAAIMGTRLSSGSEESEEFVS
jgi:hypothetical protein